MRTTAALLAAFALASTAHAEPSPAAVQAGKTYQAKCMSCHQPPDPAFTTDQAWLDQVQRTA